MAALARGARAGRRGVAAGPARGRGARPPPAGAAAAGRGRVAARAGPEGPAFGVVRLGAAADPGEPETFGFELGGSGGGRTAQDIAAGPGGTLVPVSLPLPLGIVFEERVGSSGAREVFASEVAPGSNAEAAGVQVGDVFRASSCVFRVKGKVDVVGYWANPPKDSLRPGVFAFQQSSSFDECIKAIQSHLEAVEVAPGWSAPPQTVALVLERRAG